MSRGTAAHGLSALGEGDLVNLGTPTAAAHGLSALDEGDLVNLGKPVGEKQAN